MNVPTKLSAQETDSGMTIFSSCRAFQALPIHDDRHKVYAADSLAYGYLLLVFLTP